MTANTRHGHGWDRQTIAPPQQQGPVAPPPEPAYVGADRNSHGIIPVRSVDAFFQALPPEAIQFVAYTGDVRLTSSNLVVNAKIDITSFEVPANTAFVITDVQWFGLVPSRFSNVPLLSIGPEQLAGLIRFDLTFNGNAPISATANMVNPYGSAPAVSRTGWPYVELSQSPNRGTFVMYAKSRQVITAKAYIDVIPQFWLTMLGVRVLGYALPELDLGQAIKKISR